MNNKSFAGELHAKLKSYVYVYVDTSSDQDDIFYVGKGVGNRCFSHLNSDGVGEKSDRIRALLHEGKLRIDILAFGLDDETALKVEAAAIDLLRLENLLNKQAGHSSAELGRVRVDDLIARLSVKTLSEFQDDCILIRINQRYEPSMSQIELYEATRGVWKVGQNREKAKYALAVYKGVIQEVYSIHLWLPAGSTLYGTREVTHDPGGKRWEFVGNLAEPKVRSRYAFKSIGDLLPNGAQTPFAYFGPSFLK